MIRILIADDHAVVRRGLKQIVADTPDIVVAGEASNGQEVLDRLLKADYDVVLLDITMPGSHGLDLLKELKSRKPGLPVLVLSMHPEDQYAVRALKAGASGYVTKESAPEELVAAIRKVTDGGKYVSSSLAERLALEKATGVSGPRHEVLSERELEVMLMIASGKTVSQIAAELWLSAKTVSTHRSRILEKMGIKNNVELAHYAIQNQLLD